MKKIAFILCAAFFVMSAFISDKYIKSGISGTIDPPEGAKKVWAISGSDSVSAAPFAGNFSLEVKPGTWSLYVEAAKPYRDALVENIVVQEGQYTDAGVIKLVAQ